MKPPELTSPNARRALRSSPWLCGMFSTVQLNRAITAVAQAYEITPELITSRTRQQPAAEARQLCWYLTRGGPSEIGRWLGLDHTTIIHGRRRIQDLMDAYPDFAARVEELKSKLAGRP